MLLEIPLHKQPIVASLVAEFEGHLTAVLDTDIIIKTSIHKMVVDADFIREMVCDAFGVTWQQVRSSSRKDTVVAARHSYCYLIQQYTSQADPVTAQDVNRDRTSVIHARQTLAERIDVNDEKVCSKLLPVIETIKKMIDEKNTPTT